MTYICIQGEYEHETGHLRVTKSTELSSHPPHSTPIALRNNQHCQHLDFGILASGTVKK